MEGLYLLLGRFWGVVRRYNVVMSTTETRYPTSIRLSQPEEELLEAWAEWLKATTGTHHSTSRTLRFLMRRALFDGSNSKHDKRVRAAYRNVFGNG